MKVVIAPSPEALAAVGYTPVKPSGNQQSKIDEIKSVLAQAWTLIDALDDSADAKLAQRSIESATMRATRAVLAGLEPAADEAATNVVAMPKRGEKGLVSEMITYDDNGKVIDHKKLTKDELAREVLSMIKSIQPSRPRNPWDKT